MRVKIERDVLICHPAALREENPMERAVPILPADDLRVAKEFYATKLGFRVLFEASDRKSGRASPAEE